MKKDYSVTSLVGSLIWVLAMVLRHLPLPESGIVRHVLNVLPKFGVVWIIVGLTVTFWPRLTKKPFPANRMYLLIFLSWLPVVLYKIAFPLIFGTGKVFFYPWDYAASLLAAVWLAAAHFMAQRKAPPDEAAEQGAAPEE